MTLSLPIGSNTQPPNIIILFIIFFSCPWHYFITPGLTLQGPVDAAMMALNAMDTPHSPDRPEENPDLKSKDKEIRDARSTKQSFSASTKRKSAETLDPMSPHSPGKNDNKEKEGKESKLKSGFPSSSNLKEPGSPKSVKKPLVRYSEPSLMKEMTSGTVIVIIIDVVYYYIIASNRTLSFITSLCPPSWFTSF